MPTTDDFDDLDLEIDIPFYDANSRLADAGRAIEAGKLSLAVEKMGEALSSAINEATDTIDQLKDRIDLLETEVSLLQNAQRSE